MEMKDPHISMMIDDRISLINSIRAKTETETEI